MRELYFNHAPLEGATEGATLAFFKEIITLSGIARNEQAELRFYDTLWETRLANDRTLYHYLHQLPKESDLKSIMH